MSNFEEEKEKDFYSPLNTSLVKDKIDKRFNSKSNTPNFKKWNRGYSCNAFTFEKSHEKDIERELNFNNFSYIENAENEEIYKAKRDNQSTYNQKHINIFDKINPIKNLENEFTKKKINDKLSHMLNSLKKMKLNALEIVALEKKIYETKENLKEISDDRNQVIADKINLENSFNSLLMKYNKIKEKNKDYYSVKEKNSKSLNLEGIKPSINKSSPVKNNSSIVNTEKNLDELIYELENKFAFVKMENGIILEKMDSVDESLKLNEISNNVKLKFYL